MSTNADRDQTIKAITGMMGDDTTGNSLIEQIVKEVDARTLPHHTPEDRAAIVHDVVTERMNGARSSAVAKYDNKALVLIMPVETEQGELVPPEWLGGAAK